MAGAPDKLNSPFGNRPQTLPNPVPGEGAEREIAAAQAESAQDVAAMRAQQPAENGKANGGEPTSQNPDPTVTGPAPEPAGSGETPREQDFARQSQLAQQVQEGSFDNVEDAMRAMAELQAVKQENTKHVSTNPLDNNVQDVKQFFNEHWTAAQKSFTQTPYELEQVAKNSGMFEQVWQEPDGTVMVKRPGQEAESFERAWVGARDILEMGIEGAFETAGTAAGAIATGGTGTVPSYMGAGAGAALVAKNTGDVIAEHVMGIEPDPQRSQAFEQSLTASLGAGFGFLGSVMARRAAANKLKTEAARDLYEKATTQANNAAEDLNVINSELTKAGVDYNAAEGLIRLDPHQKMGDVEKVPAMDMLAKDFSEEGWFQNFRDDVGNRLVNGFEAVTEALGKTSSTATRKATNRGAELGSDVVLTQKQLRDIEGEAIGSFRKLADDKLAGRPQVAPRTMQTMEAIRESAIDPTTGKVSAAAFADNNPAFDERQSAKILNKVFKVRSKLKNGKMSLDEAMDLHKDLNKFVDKGFSSKNGRDMALALKDLRDGLRDDFVDMMDNVLPANQSQQYKQSVGRYREIMGATRNLTKALRDGDLSKDVLIDKLTKGQGSYKQLRNLKTLIGEADPQLWNEIGRSYFHRLRNSNLDPSARLARMNKQGTFDPANKYVNWEGMSKQWDKLDERVQGELLDSVGMNRETMNSFLRTGMRVQKTGFTAIPEGQKVPVMRKVMALLGFNPLAKGQMQLDLATSFVEGLAPENKAMLWLSDGGLERVLDKMQNLKPDVKTRMRNWVADWAASERQRQALVQSYDTIAGVGAEGARRGKTVMRRDVEQGGISGNVTAQRYMEGTQKFIEDETNSNGNGKRKRGN